MKKYIIKTTKIVAFIFTWTITVLPVNANDIKTAKNKVELHQQIYFTKQIDKKNFQLKNQDSLEHLTLEEISNLYHPFLSSDCNFSLVEKKNIKQRESQYYQLKCLGYHVEKAELAIHKNDNKVLAIQAILPNYQTHLSNLLNVDSIESLTKPSSSNIELADYSDIFIKSLSLCINATDETNIPYIDLCLIVYATKKSDGQRYRLTVDFHNKNIIDSAPLYFDLATVYQFGPQDGTTFQTQLSGLDESGYLNGKNFIVFAPSEHDERVFSTTQEFNFSPDNDKKSFDQVQAYYGATKVLNWFQEQFGYNQSNEPIKIRVHANNLVGTNNARYLPDEGSGAEIHIGTGDGSHLANLSRDNDVIAHEFSHHVLFKRLKSSNGESGLLHEGYADYFAYAASNNPFLAESVKVDAPWLRTAKLEPGIRFDDPTLSWGKHNRAQIISAFLWEVREIIGQDMDSIVYNSIDYLQESSGIKDAILALLNSDRDLFKLNPDDPDADAFGIHKCEIINGALQRVSSIFRRNKC
ncbi:MAG: hypothetical protein R3B45_12610 [Bdellovibrionota bacterium]